MLKPWIMVIVFVKWTLSEHHIKGHKEVTWTIIYAFKRRLCNYPSNRSYCKEMVLNKYAIRLNTLYFNTEVLILIQEGHSADSKDQTNIKRTRSADDKPSKQNINNNSKLSDENGSVKWNNDNGKTGKMADSKAFDKLNDDDRVMIKPQNAQLVTSTPIQRDTQTTNLRRSASDVNMDRRTSHSAS